MNWCTAQLCRALYMQAPLCYHYNPNIATLQQTQALCTQTPSGDNPGTTYPTTSHHPIPLGSTLPRVVKRTCLHHYFVQIALRHLGNAGQ